MQVPVTFVELCSIFVSNVAVCINEQRCDGKSIMETMLAFGWSARGLDHDLTIEVEGSDEAPCIAALHQFSKLTLEHITPSGQRSDNFDDLAEAMLLHLEQTHATARLSKRSFFDPPS